MNTVVKNDRESWLGISAEISTLICRTYLSQESWKTQECRAWFPAEIYLKLTICSLSKKLHSYKNNFVTANNIGWQSGWTRLRVLQDVRCKVWGVRWGVWCVGCLYVYWCWCGLVVTRIWGYWHGGKGVSSTGVACTGCCTSPVHNTPTVQPSHDQTCSYHKVWYRQWWCAHQHRFTDTSYYFTWLQTAESAAG